MQRRKEEKSGERAIGKNVKKEDKTEVRNIGIRKSTNATKALRKQWQLERRERRTKKKIKGGKR